LKYVFAWLRYFFVAVGFAVTFAGGRMLLPMFLASVQNFPVSAPKPPDEPADGPAGTVDAPLGKLVGRLPGPLELLLQLAKVTQAPATALMTSAAHLCAGMLLPLTVETRPKGH
jgi:hypothetical protein